MTDSIRGACLKVLLGFTSLRENCRHCRFTSKRLHKRYRRKVKRKECEWEEGDRAKEGNQLSSQRDWGKKRLFNEECTGIPLFHSEKWQLKTLLHVCDGRQGVSASETSINHDVLPICHSQNEEKISSIQISYHGEFVFPQRYSLN
jgi:hypothetical protein